MTSRREFVHGALAALALGGPGQWLTGAAAPRLVPSDRLPLGRYPSRRYPGAGDPELKTLALRALEAAEAAGASYADIRLTVTFTADAWCNPTPGFIHREHAALGVRAFVKGAWGFAGSTVWGREDAAQLGQTAAAAAALHAATRWQRLELGAPPPVVTGEWTTPIGIDPFTVPPVEQLAVLQSYLDTLAWLFPHDQDVWPTALAVRSRRQEKTFAATTGSFTTQTLYTTHPVLGLSLTPAGVTYPVTQLQPSAQGWEVLTDGTLAPALERLAEEAFALAPLALRPVEPGRYDVVCDAHTVAHLLGRTVGLAAELDRVLGYEAAASGTSYLAPPGARLGTATVGNALLHVTANRSEPRGLATVQWDDEGVVPEAYPVVEEGWLADYHTTRELVAPLATAYAKAGRPLRSHGCAAVEHGGRAPLVQCPNLQMRPGLAATSFEDLVAGLERGLVLSIGTEQGLPTRVRTDQQQLNGGLTPVLIYVVRNGKPTHRVETAELLFRAPELWKSLEALGGPASQQTTGCVVEKGQPAQALGFSVTAGPARFRQLTVIT